MRIATLDEFTGVLFQFLNLERFPIYYLFSTFFVKQGFPKTKNRFHFYPPRRGWF